MYRVLITGSRAWAGELFDNYRARPEWTKLPSAQRDAMRDALRSARARAGGRAMAIVHGTARGADTLAGMLAEHAGCAVERWPALWSRSGTLDEFGTYEHDGEFALVGGTLYRRGRAVYDRDLALKRQFTRSGTVNRGAGVLRNQAMVSAGADECLAFLADGERNIGTRDGIRRAESAGIPTFITER